MTLLDLLNKDEGVDPSFLCDGVRLLAQELANGRREGPVGGSGTPRAERERLTYRNGHREREWDTRVGTPELQIPSCAKGSTSQGCSSSNPLNRMSESHDRMYTSSSDETGASDQG